MATLGNLPVTASLETHRQESDARVVPTAVHGKCEINLEWQGGLSIIEEPLQLLKGMPSAGIHIIGVSPEGNTLAIDADGTGAFESRLHLRTEWTVAGVEGAPVQLASGGLAELTFAASAGGSSGGSCRRAKATVHFKP